MTNLTPLVHAAAKPYLDGTWRYPATSASRRTVAYPWPVQIRGPLVAVRDDEKAIDCSTMTASLLMRVYPASPWKQEHYLDLQIARRPIVPDAPIRAAVAVGVGVRVDDFEAEHWHLVQGCTSLDPFAGHAFLVFDRGSGTLDVLESTSIDGIGPRFRVTTAKALRKRFPGALYIGRLVPR